MLIRIANEADIPQMHEVRMSVRENQLSDPSRIGLDHYRTMLAQRGQGWVAEIGDRIVGFAVADYSSSNIWALFVHPAFEGRGIGRQLHDAMMQWCFEKGAARIWLTTSPETRAERFYKSAGWRMVGREANGELRFEMSREVWSQSTSR